MRYGELARVWPVCAAGRIVLSCYKMRLLVSSKKLAVAPVREIIWGQIKIGA